MEQVDLDQQGNKIMRKYKFSWTEMVRNEREFTLTECDGLRVEHLGVDGTRCDGGHIIVRGDTPFIEWDDGMSSTNLNSLESQTITNRIRVCQDES